MNIFFSSLDPALAAQNICFYPRLRNKMILESAQMLFTVAHKLGLTVPYRPTHKNHEVVLWLGQDFSNYCWLIEHINALHKSYVSDSNKSHKSFVTVQDWLITNWSGLSAKLSLHKLTLPYLSFSEGNEDLEKQYGHYVPNPRNKKKPYAVANSFEDAVAAYREYIQRKSYAKGKQLVFV